MERDQQLIGLTITRGVFERQQNLTFGEYEIPQKRNKRSAYDAHFKMSHAEKKKRNANLPP